MKHTTIRPDCTDDTWVEGQREKTNAYYNVQGGYEDYRECGWCILLYPVGSTTGTMSDLVRFEKPFWTAWNAHCSRSQIPLLKCCPPRSPLGTATPLGYATASFYEDTA